MTEVLYRKWRPQTFAEVVGQDHVTQTLLNALSMGRVAHAYLFCGPRGTGKTSTGRILAKAVNCLTNGQGEPCNTCVMCTTISEGRSLDLLEIDAASNTGVDNVRDLRDKVGFAPNEARYKVYIIDEAHMLSSAAFNALLKTLEEPPPHVIFVLATTEVHKVPATVLSRCQRFDFHRIPQSAVTDRLSYICEQEGITIEPGGLSLVATAATGSLRDAANLLDQLIINYGNDIKLPQVRALLGMTEDARLHSFAEAILTGNLSSGIDLIGILAHDGLDLRQFNRQFVEYLRELFMLKVGSGALVGRDEASLSSMKGLIETVSVERIVRALRLFSQIDFRHEGPQTLPLELALVDCARAVEPTDEPAPQARSEPRLRRVEERAQAPSENEASALREASGAPLHTPIKRDQPVPPGNDELIQRLRANWMVVLEGLRATNKTIEALVRSCEPLSSQDDVVVLGFFYAFHKDRIEDVRNRKVVEEVVSRVLGQPIRIQCTLTPRERRSRPEPSSDDHLVEAALKMGARLAEH